MNQLSRTSPVAFLLVAGVLLWTPAEAHAQDLRHVETVDLSPDPALRGEGFVLTDGYATLTRVLTDGEEIVDQTRNPTTGRLVTRQSLPDDELIYPVLLGTTIFHQITESSGDTIPIQRQAETLVPQPAQSPFGSTFMTGAVSLESVDEILQFWIFDPNINTEEYQTEFVLLDVDSSDDLTLLQRVQGGVIGPAPSAPAGPEADPIAGEPILVEDMKQPHDAVLLAAAHLYVTATLGDALIIFDRDQSTSELTFRQSIVDGVNGVDGLAGAEDLVASADGAFLYVAGKADDAIAIFARAPGDGSLTALPPESMPVGFRTVWQIAHLNDETLVALAENEADAGTLLVYDRDPTTGLLSLRQTLIDGIDGVDGIPTAPPNQEYRSSTLEVSDDGRHLYIHSIQPQQMTLFTTDLFADDFESGDLSAWSSALP